MRLCRLQTPPEETQSLTFPTPSSPPSASSSPFRDPQGFCAFATMMSLGEMATYLPSKRGFAYYGSRFVDPALGVAIGYCYLAK